MPTVHQPPRWVLGCPLHGRSGREEVASRITKHSGCQSLEFHLVAVSVRLRADKSWQVNKNKADIREMLVALFIIKFIKFHSFEFVTYDVVCLSACLKKRQGRREERVRSWDSGEGDGGKWGRLQQMRLVTNGVMATLSAYQLEVVHASQQVKGPILSQALSYYMPRTELFINRSQVCIK